MIKAGIVGGAGYTAGELIRLLVFHPAVDIDFEYGYPVEQAHEAHAYMAANRNTGKIILRVR